MAKKSAIQKNLRRIRMVARYYEKRLELKSIASNKSLPRDEIFRANLELSSMPSDASKTKIRNRCELTGRPRGYHRRFRMSRICLREMALRGEIPGVTKSSW